MKRLLCTLFAAGLMLALSSVAMADHSVEIRLEDGSTWRGSESQMVELVYRDRRVEIPFEGKLVKVADLYIIVEGNIAGEIKQNTIFRADIVSMRTMTGNDTTEKATKRSKRSGANSQPTWDTEGDEPVLDEEGRPRGVFVLPLDGAVGTYIRREEIKKIGEHADKFGPGQIIVLLINTNGGSALESQFIADEIFEIRERHRVVAWIQKAISAGCQTAMCCQEIYFMTEGSAGAVTTWNPGSGQSIKGEQLEKSKEHLAKIAERSGYSPFIAYAMKTNSAMCSYDKDQETGEVTFYNDLSGEYVLSDDDSNLSFTSSSAEHSGFSKGTADTGEELAKLLDLPKWYEIDSYGRDISKRWQDTCKRAEEEIPRLIARRGYWKSSGDAIERIGALIQIDEQLLRWHQRAPNIARGMLPPEEAIRREIAQYRKQLADMRRERRGG